MREWVTEYSLTPLALSLVPNLTPILHPTASLPIPPPHSFTPLFNPTPTQLFHSKVRERSKRGGESGARERVQEWREKGGKSGSKGAREGRERGGEKEMGREWSETGGKRSEREKGARKRWGESGVRKRGARVERERKGVIGERRGMEREGREWSERERERGA